MLLERHLRKLFTAGEGLKSDLPHACWNRHVLDFGTVEPVVSDSLDALRDYHLPHLSEVPDAYVPRYCCLIFEPRGARYRTLKEIRPETVCHADSLESAAAVKRALVYLLKCARERDFLDPAILEDPETSARIAATVVLERLQALVQHDSPQTLTTAKRCAAYFP